MKFYNIINLLLANQMDTTILYVLMIALIILNISFIIIFAISIMKHNKLEKCLENIKIQLTEYDKTQTQPPHARPGLETQTKYLIIYDKNSVGWKIIDKNTKEHVGFAKTKTEANEIVKNLLRNE